MRFLLFILPFFVFFSFKKESSVPQKETPYSIEEERVTNPFEVYPNPVDQIFTLKNNYFYEGQTQLFIFDISGKVVLKDEEVIFDEENTTQVNVNHFTSGLYLVQLRSGNYSVTKKIFKY